MTEQWGQSGGACQSRAEPSLERHLHQEFQSVLGTLRQDPLDFRSQSAALRLLNRVRGEGLRPSVEEWIAACGFGNLENAAVVIPVISDEAEELYILCSRLAAIAFLLGKRDVALILFGHCLTSDLPPLTPLQETEAEYLSLADHYDDDPMHRVSVDDFMGFLRRQLALGGPYDIVDAPCGTGLAGPELRPLARRLVGSDLSRDMLSVARRRGCYDDLIAGDLAEVLPLLSGTLVVCHGSLQYFRDLDRGGLVRQWRQPCLDPADQ